MTALAGVVVKRTFSVLARQFAGLPGLKTHEAIRQDFANFNQMRSRRMNIFHDALVPPVCKFPFSQTMTSEAR